MRGVLGRRTIIADGNDHLGLAIPFKSLEQRAECVLASFADRVAEFDRTQ